MKTVEDLRVRAQELIKEAAMFSRQATEILPTDREQGKMLMRQAREAGKRFQVLVGEILRLESQQT
jgi:uncharacterized protein YceH (UPF0502 family)